MKKQFFFEQFTISGSKKNSAPTLTVPGSVTPSHSPRIETRVSFPEVLASSTRPTKSITPREKSPDPLKKIPSFFVSDFKMKEKTYHDLQELETELAISKQREYEAFKEIETSTSGQLQPVQALFQSTDKAGIFLRKQHVFLSNLMGVEEYDLSLMRVHGMPSIMDFDANPIDLVPLFINNKTHIIGIETREKIFPGYICMSHAPSLEVLNGFQTKIPFLIKTVKNGCYFFEPPSLTHKLPSLRKVDVLTNNKLPLLVKNDVDDSFYLIGLDSHQMLQLKKLDAKIINQFPELVFDNTIKKIESYKIGVPLLKEIQLREAHLSSPFKTEYPSSLEKLEQETTDCIKEYRKHAHSKELSKKYEEIFLKLYDEFVKTILEYALASLKDYIKARQEGNSEVSLGTVSMLYEQQIRTEIENCKVYFQQGDILSSIETLVDTNKKKLSRIEQRNQAYEKEINVLIAGMEKEKENTKEIERKKIFLLLEKKQFFKDISYEESFLLACQQGYINTIKYLLSEKIEVLEYKDMLGMNGIHYVAQMGQIEILEFIHQNIKKFDSNVQSDSGLSPLHFAIFQSNVAIANYLIKNCKSNINLETLDGSSPLHLATLKESIELLIRHGANTTKKNQDGWTPLEQSILNDRIEVLPIYFENGIVLSPERFEEIGKKLPITKGNALYNMIVKTYDNSDKYMNPADRISKISVFPNEKNQKKEIHIQIDKVNEEFSNNPKF